MEVERCVFLWRCSHFASTSLEMYATTISSLVVWIDFKMLPCKRDHERYKCRAHLERKYPRGPAASIPALDFLLTGATPLPVFYFLPPLAGPSNRWDMSVDYQYQVEQVHSLTIGIHELMSFLKCRIAQEYIYISTAGMC